MAFSPETRQVSKKVFRAIRLLRSRLGLAAEGSPGSSPPTGGLGGFISSLFFSFSSSTLTDRKSTRLNSLPYFAPRFPSSSCIFYFLFFILYFFSLFFFY